MGLKINGSTSGSIEIDVPAVAGTDTAITIPAVNGGEFIVSDSSGRVGIGTTSPNRLLTANGIVGVQTSGTEYLRLYGQSGSAIIDSVSSKDLILDANGASNSLVFFQGGAEAARIDSSKRLLVGTTSAVNSSYTGGSIQLRDNAGGTVVFKRNDGTSTNSLGILEFHSSFGRAALIDVFNDGTHSGSSTPGAIKFSTTPSGTFGSPTERMRLASTGVSYAWNNNNTTAFIVASSVGSNTTPVFAVRHSASTITGGTNAYFINANGTAGSASDVNLKKNIETTRDGYLEDLNRLRVVKYNWNDQEDTEPRELGLIAQEVEEVFPGLACDMSNNDEGGDKATVKGIKYSVLPVMLLKALQEADAKIEAQAAQLASQAATIAALDARLTALEGGAS